MFRKMLLVLFIVTVSFLFLPDEAAAAGCDPANIIISEIDYAQSGTDTAEFVELYFVSAASVSLCELHLVDGSGWYATIDLAGTYTAGQFLVIGDDNMSPPPDEPLGCVSSCISNGPAGVALINTDTGTNEAFVSYEGALFYQGISSTNINCSDPNADGSCQNGNTPGYTDWIFSAPPTPGSAGPTAITLSAFGAGANSNAGQVLGLSFILLTLTGFAGWLLNRRQQA